MILDLHRQGLSPSAIARQLGIDRKTVRAHYRPGPGAADLPKRPPGPEHRRRLPALSAGASGGLSGFDRRPPPAGIARARLHRRLHRGQARRAAISGLNATRRFEVRFETPPGEQAQVDFARFEVVFADEPGVTRIVWLFSMVLGFSRLIWARFVVHQDLQSVLRCHVAAFDAIGGAPREILYDRMKTAVIGEDADGLVIYNRSLIDLARHFGFHPQSLPPVPGQDEGQSRAAVPLHPPGFLPRGQLPQSRRPQRSVAPLARHRGQSARCTPPPNAWSTRRSPKSSRRCGHCRWHPTARC